MEENDDLSINGEGSPIHLKKVIEKVIDDKKHLHVFLDQDHSGFYTADAPVVVLNSEIFKQHALEYQANAFNQKQLSLFLVRHLLFFFYDKKDLVYPHDQFSVSKLSDFLEKDPEGQKIFKEMLNKITYIKNNPEWQQIVGMIITLCGCMNICKKEGKWARLFIENPENNLHPKRQAAFMSFLHEIYSEYTGINLSS